MEQISLIRIFISCPEDVEDLLDDVRAVIARVSGLAEHLNWSLRPVHWRTRALPGRGSPTPQDSIFECMEGCDWYLGIVGGTLGSPTGRTKEGSFDSGTEAEFWYAFKRREKFKVILLYFIKDRAEGVDRHEVGRVEDFRRRIGDKFLYRRLASTEDLTEALEDDLRGHFFKFISLPRGRTLKDKFSSLNRGL